MSAHWAQLSSEIRSNYSHIFSSYYSYVECPPNLGGMLGLPKEHFAPPIIYKPTHLYTPVTITASPCSTIHVVNAKEACSAPANSVPLPIVSVDLSTPSTAATARALPQRVSHGKHGERRRDRCPSPASITWPAPTGLARQHKERPLERHGHGLLVPSRPHEARLPGFQGRQVRSSMPSTPHLFMHMWRRHHAVILHREGTSSSAAQTTARPPSQKTSPR